MDEQKLLLSETQNTANGFMLSKMSNLLNDDRNYDKYTIEDSGLFVFSWHYAIIPSWNT